MTGNILVNEFFMYAAFTYEVNQMRLIKLLSHWKKYRLNPNSLLTIVIFARDKVNFKQPLETTYSDKNICVTGTLKAYNNKPEIIISKPEDITIE